MTATKCNLDPCFSRYSEAEITGTRTNYQKTFFPSSTKAGEQISVVLPALKPGTCLVPGSVNVLFKFSVYGTKSTFNNNLSKVLVEQLTVKYGGVVIYDNKNEAIFTCYRDLWLTQEERVQKRQFGIMKENMRKKVSGEDTYKTDTEIEGLHGIFGGNIPIPLDKIIGDHERRAQ